LVFFTPANFVKCLKIVEKEHFNENEWKTAKILIEKKNKNIIDYDCVNEIKTKNNKKYIVFMLEYANAEVCYIFFKFYFLKNLSSYLEFERNFENIKKIEHVLYDFTKQIRFFIFFI
jgi:hypothetical protein